VDRQRAQAARTLLFVTVAGPLHALNPLTKLMAFLWTVSAAIVLPPTLTLVLVVAGVVLAYVAGVGGVVPAKLVATIVPLAAALALMHGFLIVRPDEVPLGPLHVSPAGFRYAYSVVARIAAMLTASLLFVTTTHPGDVLASLDAAGVSPAVGYLIASPLLLLEPFSKRTRAIRDAQRARGMNLTGTWKARVRALPALLVPLVTLALSDLDHRAMVLESRAFGGEKRRTVLDAPPDSRGQSRFRRIVGALAVVQLAVPLLWH
jgi:energy-coupling factor transport system permease protein